MGWEVRPKPGVTPLELFDIGASRDNADLVLVKGGIEITRVDYDPYTAMILNAKMPTIDERLETPRGGGRITRELSFKRMLYAGSSPFRQIIDDELRRHESLRKLLTMKELAGIVANQTDEKVSRIMKLLKRMNDAGQILLKKGRVYLGPRHPDIAVRRDYPVTEFVPGKHPVKLYIWKYVDEGGTRSITDIENRLKRIKWIKRRKTLEFYLKEMVRDGYLRKIGETDYEAVVSP